MLLSSYEIIMHQAWTEFYGYLYIKLFMTSELEEANLKTFFSLA